LYAVRQALHNGAPSLDSVINDNDIGQRRFARVIAEVKRTRNEIPPDFQVWLNYQRIDKIRVFFQAPPGS
jgi:hypothetical protein